MWVSGVGFLGLGFGVGTACSKAESVDVGSRAGSQGPRALINPKHLQPPDEKTIKAEQNACAEHAAGTISWACSCYPEAWFQPSIMRPT